MRSISISKWSNLHWANLILLFPSLVSLTAGIHNGLKRSRSQDYQWSGAHLFSLHYDPYLVYLLKDPGHQILKSQVPNYLQELYVLLWPMGMLNEHTAAALWLGFNLLFAVVSVLLLGHIFKLTQGKTLSLGLLLATSTPFRIAIGNGQQSLLLLMLLLLVFAAPARGGWTLGLSYFKYSFAPILFFYFACKKAYRILLLSLVLPIAGWLIFWIRVGGSPLRTALEPVLVGRIGVSPGTADLCTLMMLVAPRWVPFSLLLAVALSALLAYAIHRREHSRSQAVSGLAICSLFLFPHLIYDFVLLVIPAALLLSDERPKRLPSIASILSLIVLVYLMPSLGGHVAALICFWINFTLLLVLCISVLSPRKLSHAQPSISSIKAVRTGN